MKKPIIPAGWRRLRVGTIRHREDRFMNAYGKWIPTLDHGCKIRRGVPCFHERPEYAGVYIRRVAVPNTRRR